MDGFFTNKYINLIKMVYRGKYKIQDLLLQGMII